MESCKSSIVLSDSSLSSARSPMLGSKIPNESFLRYTAVSAGL
ncbi:Uncharacterised protein [Vibrio cholerae]|nr:Uncharacterised protein [Vibrio cholerae]